MMRTVSAFVIGLCMAWPAQLIADESATSDSGLTVKITRSLEQVEINLDGQPLTIMRNQDTGNMIKRGTIPGAINLHYKQLLNNSEENVADILEDLFGVTRGASLFDFSHAKTLVLVCNGIWCGQSPTNIKSLVKLGYPPHKLKYYRGGMQAWESLGLTTIKP